MVIIINKGTIFDIKKFAIDDGPGIRTTIFLKGCPLHCWWCHNPEGQMSTPELMFRAMRCIGCNECVKNCPKRAILNGTKKISINRKYCNLCGRCSQKCPSDALAIIGKEMSVMEIMSEIEKDIIFYEESQGGVTFSGGEPLLQLDFLDALLAECEASNINAAVDTCGYVSNEAMDKISDNVDLFLYDIKTMDERVHKKYTGVSNKQILGNFKRLAQNGNNILVRLPIIPSINDSEENITKTAEFVLSCGIENISILPYHRAGSEKYKGLSRAYRLKKIRSPSDQNLRLIKEKLESFGLKVEIGGG